MVESYDLVSPWGLEYKTTVTESNQSLPSVVQRQKSTGVTCSINDRQGILTVQFLFILLLAWLLNCITSYYSCCCFCTISNSNSEPSDSQDLKWVIVLPPDCYE